MPSLTHGAVTIEVDDDGPGMDETVLGKIFEPYFTTKKKGTGMGLAAVHGTVHSHGGTLDVESEEGERHGLRR